MKKIGFLVIALLLLCTNATMAYDFQIGGIYYSISSQENTRVSVTFGTNKYTGSVVIPESITKPVATGIFETFDAWTSTNKTGSSTSQTSYTLNVEAGNVLKFDWEVSSESNFDWLVITLDGTQIIKQSGTQSGNFEKVFDTAGSYTLVVKYTKDGSGNNGNDEGRIYNVALATGMENVEYKVVGIGYSAFEGCTNLTSVTIPNSVTSIGQDAFKGCTRLSSVVIGDGVTSVIPDAFKDTAWYNNQPDGVVYIGKVLYKYKGTMPENTSIVVKDGILRIEAEAFVSCKGLTNIEIPNSVESIGYFAFLDCTGLACVKIPDSVTSIEDAAFKNCTGLTSAVIGNGITSIGYGMFQSCSQLIDVTIPNGVKYLEYCAFAYCSSLEKVTLPNSITHIGGAAFFDSGLKSIELPDSVKKIGAEAFAYCDQLTSVVMGNNVVSIGKSAFRASALTNITISKNVSSIEDYAFYYCKNLTGIELGDSVTSIGQYAFEECISLTSIIIPNSVTSIGISAFIGCTGLTSVTIGNSVTSIGSGAFELCTGLTSIIIPNSVTSIGSYAFYGCRDLKVVVNLSDLVLTKGSSSYGDVARYATVLAQNVELVDECYFNTEDAVYTLVYYKGNSIKLSLPDNYKGEDYEIGSYAFLNKTGLKEVNIPACVTGIGDYAFSGCTGLESIISHIPADKLSAPGESAFSYINKATCTLYVPCGTKDIYAITDGWKYFNNILEMLSNVTVVVSEYGSTTYCSPYALDFSNVEGLKAYVATGYNTNTEILTLTRVRTAKEAVGLFLVGEPGEYVIPVIDESTYFTTNLLVGVLENTTVNSTSDDGVYANYKYDINNGGSVPEFYQYTDGSSINAGNAYLQIPLSWLGDNTSNAITISFDEGEFTDIDEIDDELKGENGKVKTIYDLSGRVVENPTSGIYIIDGKKVLVK